MRKAAYEAELSCYDRIKDAVANAQVDYNTRLYNKLNVGDFYTKLQEARAALS